MTMQLAMAVVLLCGCGGERSNGTPAPGDAAPSNLGDVASDMVKVADLMPSPDAAAMDLAHPAKDAAAVPHDLATVPDDLSQGPDLAIPLCGGVACTTGYVCNPSGPTCVPCGQSAQACCGGNTCSQTNTVCSSSAIGGAGGPPTASGPNDCRNCGGMLQQCCTATTQCMGSMTCVVQSLTLSLCM